jgi:mRNA-degrading endonuclease RelE of RelBE toxin-antitoxin system
VNFNVYTLRVFDRQAKRQVRKYPSLKPELISLVEKLKQNPMMGTAIGNNCYKIRLSIASKNKGKSSVARVITHLHVEKRAIYLLSIYDKEELQNLDNRFILAILQDIK